MNVLKYALVFYDERFSVTIICVNSRATLGLDSLAVKDETKKNKEITEVK